MKNYSTVKKLCKRHIILFKDTNRWLRNKIINQTIPSIHNSVLEMAFSNITMTKRLQVCLIVYVM